MEFQYIYRLCRVWRKKYALEAGNRQRQFTVKGDLKNAAVTVNGEYVYTGSPITPDVSVTWNGTTLTNGTDYTLNYENSNGGRGNLINAGTVTVTAAGTGNYTGTATGTFTIAPASYKITLTGPRTAPRRLL